ncbi:MAG TPA: phage holin family protein [Candidatus Lustribacter sp.]
MHFLIRLVVNAIALMIVAYLFNGHGVTVTGPVGALVAAFVLGIINAILRPILFVLTLPLQIVTLGLFTFVINGLLFYWVGHWGIGLMVDGFWPAFWAAIVLGIVSFVLSSLLKGVDRKAV